jgi:hypothetical protein
MTNDRARNQRPNYQQHKADTDAYIVKLKICADQRESSALQPLWQPGAQTAGEDYCQPNSGEPGNQRNRLLNEPARKAEYG